MLNLNNIFFENSKKTRGASITLLGLSFLGILDALYLAVSHYRGVPVSCEVLTGCSTVLSSEYAVVLGVPLAVLGLVYYLGIFLSTALFLDTKKQMFLAVALVLPFFGLLASAFFITLQVAVIEAICFYCLISATITLLMACVSTYVIITGKKTSI
ncbi:MAG: vitamin K epoxide reductase family protein [bacterium]|nr:vitamin K epoxide reductase family protein [bacterium]